MAVYTNITSKELEDLLSNYDIGNLINFVGIEQGVENTNYFVTTTKNKYVLTIYEKRTNKNDLPYFLNLMKHLSTHKIASPLPIANIKGEFLNKIANKDCVLVSFLKGKTVKSIQNFHLKELGHNMAKMHNISHDFHYTRKNNMSLDNWIDIFDNIKDRCDSIKYGLKDEITKELQDLNQNWPKNLPKGIIHGDLFPDNVFFKDEKLVGIIDFYFACNDFFAYDLAICLNAWCFERAKEFNITKAKLLISSYNKVRPLSSVEIEYLPILAKGAAMRFLLTRSYDWLNYDGNEMVTPHNPIDYLDKLRFYNSLESFSLWA